MSNFRRVVELPASLGRFFFPLFVTVLDVTSEGRVSFLSVRASPYFVLRDASSILHLRESTVTPDPRSAEDFLPSTGRPPSMSPTESPPPASPVLLTVLPVVSLCS